MAKPALTIVVPTYRPHFPMVDKLVSSIDLYVTDPACLAISIVVESENVAFIESLKQRHPRLNIQPVTTEAVLADFGVTDSPAAFLKQCGKFTFQALKKVGGTLAAASEWTLVLDSESTFLRPFSARDLIENYKSRKYVFYTRVEERGDEWKASLSETVTQNAAELVGGPADRWFMEYYHWFYEPKVWRSIVASLRADGGLREWLDHKLPRGIFENVLYYQYVSLHAELGYELINVAEDLRKRLPKGIAGRIAGAMKGRLAIFGLTEYLLSLVTVDEVALLEPFFSAYKLPFLRLEPPTLDPGYLQAVRKLPSLVALTSSHRLSLLEKRTAVLVSGEFRNVFANIASIRSFTSGVACDLYIHCWTTDAVATIQEALQPKVLLAEDPPDLTELIEQIRMPEPDTKPQRNLGSLLMLYGIKQACDLVKEHHENYDHFVRLRPDMEFQQSLRELLLDISNNEDLREDSLYIPNSFHSQGINDQLAIGGFRDMESYASAYDYAAERLGSMYFNPEYLVLCNLLGRGVNLSLLPMTYLLMRRELPDFNRVHQIQRLQEDTWWSAFVPGPWTIRPANAFFEVKRRSVEYMQSRGEYLTRDLFVSTLLLPPRLRIRWGAPILRMTLERHFRDPQVRPKIVFDDGEGAQALYLHLLQEGFELSPNSSADPIFIEEGDAPGEVRLVQFSVDDLEAPSAVLTLRTLDAGHLSPLATTQQPRLAHEAHIPVPD